MAKSIVEGIRRYKRIVFGVFLVTLTIVFIIIRDTQGPPADLPQSEEQIFPLINETQLREVRLSYPKRDDDGLVFIKAADGTWGIVGDNQPLDPTEVDVMLAILANMTFLERFPVDEDQLGVYGLSDGGQFVAEFSTDTQLTARYIVGNLGDKERTYAVRVNDLTQVFVIDRTPIDFLMITYQEPPYAE